MKVVFILFVLLALFAEVDVVSARVDDPPEEAGVSAVTLPAGAYPPPVSGAALLQPKYLPEVFEGGQRPQVKISKNVEDEAPRSRGDGEDGQSLPWIATPVAPTPYPGP